MSSPLSRREILLALTTTGVVGTAAGATAQIGEGNPPTPIRSQDERLEQVLRLVEKADRRLGSIQETWGNPPDPIVPETIAVLESLNNECANIMDTANALLRTLRS